MKSKAPVLVYSITDLDYPILLMQEGQDSFGVVYGGQSKSLLSYSQAKEEFADCLFHALALAGKLDNQ